MATKTTIKAETRSRSGSGVLKQLRREGLLPSVIYGKDFENINLKIDAKTFRDILAHSSSDSIVVNLEIDGKESRMAFLKAVQYDALSGHALHADFRAIDSKTTITANIPVIVLGEAPGVKSGGVVEQYVHAIEVHCLPNDLPDKVEVNISELQLSDSIHLESITFPSGVTTDLPADVVIVHIGQAGPSAEELEADAEAAASEGAAAGEEPAAEGDSDTEGDDEAKAEGEDGESADAEKPEEAKD